MSIADKLVTIAENEHRVYDSGYDKAEKEMWNAFIANGARTQYQRAFYSTDFTGRTFPEGVRIEGSNHMFYDYRGTEYPKGIDLSNVSASSLENEYSDQSATAGLFNWSTAITKIYDMKLPAPKVYQNTFSYLRSCTTIEMPIKVREDTIWRTAFVDAKGIVNMRFEGVIGQNGLDVSACPLSHDSIMSIINCLKDYSSIGGTYTVTLGAANIAKLTEEERLIADMKGWILA